MKSIAFIIPYFGKFGNYFQLWLNSCKNNPTVDWIIFTDDKTMYNYPNNVKIHYTSLQYIASLFSKKLGFLVYLENPYKLCDLKPLYGDIFNDYLQEYDFWGYCDTDLIWGDIRKFLNEKLLNQYDKIFSFGHCTIIRNESEINRFYMLETPGVYNYRLVCTTPFSYGFDECDQANAIFEKFYPKSFLKDVFCFDVEVTKLHFYPSEGMPNAIQTKYLFEYDNGKLRGYYLDKGDLKNQEYMYLHLQKRKMKMKIENEDKHFLIVPNVFIDWQTISTSNFYDLQPKHTFYADFLRGELKRIYYAIFDNAPIQSYKRNHLSYIFDKLFGRSDKYEYWFKQ